jgi:uncharacterized membrane protein (UPF0127 family)
MAQGIGLMNTTLRRNSALATILLLFSALLSTALLGCDEPEKKDAKKSDVVISGKTFHLELALEPATRFKGLSGRDKIDDDGGMLFVFPRPETLAFVMRDCPIDIDIIFLDGAGRVVATHKMLHEKERSEEEKPIDPATGVNMKYEERLKKYPSGFASQFVIELKGGTLDTFKPALKRGDKVTLDTEALKKRSK